MSKLKNIIISERYKVKHFIDVNDYCELYTAQEITSSQLVSLAIYNASKISKDDLDENNDLREIGFLKLGIDGFPKLMGFGKFSHDLEEYRYIATQFIPGESVLDRMKRKGFLDEIDATNVALRIAEIANSIHNRDKPILLNGLSLDNIVFDMSGDSESIMVRNLINVRFFEEDFKYKYIDGVLMNNLAPECYKNVFTAKTDQYIIVALLYQMLHGYPVWHNDDQILFKDLDEFSINKHLKDRDSQLKFMANIDAHIKTLISKGLSSSADDRYRSITDLISFLRRDKIYTSQKSTSKKPNVKVGNGFKDIAGMDALKNQLQTQVLDVLRKPEHFKKYGVTVPNGMLLYGPPGCGKTFISEKFCEEAAFNFMLIKPSDLSSIYVSGGEEKIGQLFKEAESNSPTVICFDEVDAIMPKRTEDANQSISARVNEFLAQINKCSERGIFIIATTNKPDLIDSAMLRAGRLEVQIYIPPPDLLAREELFKLYLKNRYSDTDINYHELAKLTADVVASDIEFIVNQASHKAAMQEIKISMSVLKDILGSFKPSVSKEIINAYEKEHKSFTDSEKSSERKPIGFKINKS
ncbi:AAA family ATPase [Flavobacteriales bacterium]|nr:AAA family ATPase [Flavobacteriales bacterium]